MLVPMSIDAIRINYGTGLMERLPVYSSANVSELNRGGVLISTHESESMLPLGNYKSDLSLSAILLVRLFCPTGLLHYLIRNLCRNLFVMIELLRKGGPATGYRSELRGISQDLRHRQ